MKKVKLEDVVTDHNPRSQTPFLRWEAGVYETRKMTMPIYEGARAVDTVEINADCMIFNVLGFGETESDAMNRAMRFVEQ